MRSFISIFFILVSLFCDAQLPKMENGKLILEKQVNFKTGSAELTDEGKDVLEELVCEEVAVLLTAGFHTCEEV